MILICFKYANRNKVKKESQVIAKPQNERKKLSTKVTVFLIENNFQMGKHPDNELIELLNS